MGLKTLNNQDFVANHVSMYYKTFLDHIAQSISGAQDCVLKSLHCENTKTKSIGLLSWILEALTTNKIIHLRVNYYDKPEKVTYTKVNNPKNYTDIITLDMQNYEELTEISNIFRILKKVVTSMDIVAKSANCVVLQSSKMNSESEFKRRTFEQSLDNILDSMNNNGAIAIGNDDSIGVVNNSEALTTIKELSRECYARLSAISNLPQSTFSGEFSSNFSNNNADIVTKDIACRVFFDTKILPLLHSVCAILGYESSDISYKGHSTSDISAMDLIASLKEIETSTLLDAQQKHELANRIFTRTITTI